MSLPLSRLGCVAALAFAFIALPSAAQTPASTTACAQVRVSGNTTSLTGCNFANPVLDAVALARQFIAAHAPDFKNPQATADLQLIDVAHGIGTQHVRFQQMLLGIPVYNGVVSVHLDRNDHVRRLVNSNDLPPATTSTRLNVPQVAAESSATGVLAALAAGQTVSGLQVRSTRQIWYPRNDGLLVLAWEITVTSEAPLLDYVVIVDGTTGRILASEDRLQHWTIGHGRVFHPNPLQASGDVTMTAGSSPSYVDSFATYDDLPGLEDGTGLLRGRYADTTLQTAFSSQFPLANEPTRSYFYTRTDPRFRQTNAYFHVDSSQRYIRALGFAADRTVSTGIHDDPIDVYVDFSSADNSNFSPSSDALFLGYGGVPDAEDGDIITHEYHHAIQHAQNANNGRCFTFQPPYPSGSCEMRAMMEGSSDYFAAVTHARDGNAAYQQANAPCVGEWDATAYDNRSPPCLRRTDSSKKYPADLIYEVHADGEIWSRALWDLRNLVGGNVASQLVLEHQFSLGPDANMPAAAQLMIDVDEELFSGVNEVALRQVFCARGILTGADCNLPANSTLIVPVAKDTLIREPDVTRNEGQSELLRLKGDTTGANSRVLVAFDLSFLDVSKVKSAVLELTVASSDTGWGTFGRSVDAHPLARDFTEGNGALIALSGRLPPAQQRKGTGPGATWNCATDTNIANETTECAGPDVWLGGAPVGSPLPSGTATPPAVVNDSMTGGRLRWTVTNDIKVNNASRWVIKKTFEDKPGLVDLYSREGALALDPLDAALRRPHLVITLN